MNLAIDLIIVLGLVWLAVQIVATAAVFRAILMFIVFGLVMALAWARLHAPDLALAEAAIGAGITGALLLVTWRRLQLLETLAETQPASGRWLAALVAAAAGAVLAAIGFAALQLPADTTEAGAEVLTRLPEIGVENPVTGVLLGFRAYDTLLEMAVLLAAWLGARAVAVPERPGVLPGPAHVEVPLVGALLSMVVPICLVVAVYLLQAGGSAPGGAFQGGAVLAAGGVLLCLSGRLEAAVATDAVHRFGLIAGLAVFSVMGLAMLFLGRPMLALPGTWALYLVETALLISIALTLVLLFAAAPGLRRHP